MHRISDERLREWIQSAPLPTSYLAGGDVLAMAVELAERRAADRDRRMPWSGRGVAQDGGTVAIEP
jgi:hypothetical protein